LHILAYVQYFGVVSAVIPSDQELEMTPEKAELAVYFGHQDLEERRRNK
jgi:hypothetical protein